MADDRSSARDVDFGQDVAKLLDYANGNSCPGLAGRISGRSIAGWLKNGFTAQRIGDAMRSVSVKAEVENAEAYITTVLRRQQDALSATSSPIVVKSDGDSKYRDSPIPAGLTLHADDDVRPF
jgi:hypothetical protein